MADRKAGLPIDYVDPAEGNFMLTESVCVTGQGRGGQSPGDEDGGDACPDRPPRHPQGLPVPLYEGENFREDARSSNVKAFPEPLTVDLLKRHQALMN